MKKLLHCIGNIEIKYITHDLLDQAIIKICRLTKSGSDYIPPSYATATQNRIKSALRSFFKWTFMTKLLDYNPADQIMLAKSNSQRTIPITTPEVFGLLRCIERSEQRLSIRDAALFATYAFTGIRKSAALMLTFKDYDLTHKILTIYHNKGGSSYQVPVSFLMEYFFKRHLASIPDRLKSSDSPIFASSKTGRALSARQVNSRFKKWKSLAQISKTLTIHSFRAGVATTLYKATGDVLLVARMLGHSSLDSTRLYVKEDLFTIRDALNKCFQK